MDEQRKSSLNAAGMDVAGVLDRFMGNETLLEKMLQKFAEDTNFQKLKEAAACQDEEAGLHCAHTLKGLCGNLAMSELYELFTRQVQCFRNGDPAGAFAMISEIEPVYERILAAIRLPK